jgi:hypothetical protein
MLAVCTLDDPLPLGGLGVGRIKRLFEINSSQFVQVTHDEHPYWMEVIPASSISSTTIRLSYASCNAFKALRLIVFV